MGYLDTFEATMSSVLFISFKVIVVVLSLLLILSLILLAIGCLIKSQKIKSKFLRVVPALLIGNIALLLIPLVIVHFKNLTC